MPDCRRLKADSRALTLPDGCLPVFRGGIDLRAICARRRPALYWRGLRADCPAPFHLDTKNPRLSPGFAFTLPKRLYPWGFGGIYIPKN